MDSRTPGNVGAAPELEPVAIVALDIGRLLMQAGARAAIVGEIVERVACDLGAERVDLRIGYASLEITIAAGERSVTRVRKVGHLGVNQRLNQGLWHLAERVSRKELLVEEVRDELALLSTDTPTHPRWFVAVAVGLACAAFGRLLRVDWPGTAPVFVAAAVGQYIRAGLVARGVNLFICSALVSFISSLVGSLGARWVGSETITEAMIASVLLLVPGLPAVNAQTDILEGHPTLGSARAVTVVMTLIFIAVGLWVGPVLLKVWP